ncbi:MAG: cellulase family glycosylhydrolase [Kineosporiaceae bacterium]
MATPSSDAPGGWRARLAARRSRLLLALASVVAAALAATGLTSLTAPATAAGPGFVTRCGIRFCLDGKVWYFAGANTYDVFTYGGSYGDTETTYMDKARIDKHFAQLAADKVAVLRLWMFSHEDWHGFESSEGVYNDQQFALFDYAIEAARKNGIRLIPVFENYWEAYGGIDTRLKWEGLPGGQANRWRFFNKTACPGCFTQYKNYVSYALNRVNHYSGVAYKDDPTIMAWELMNEPRYEKTGTDEDQTGRTLRAWVDEMGAYIKGIDGNHLLGAGLEGHQAKYGFGGDEGNPFVYVQQSPAIDFTSAHPYPDEGWAGLDIPKTKALIRAWISDSHDVVGKPFFMGEWNVHQNWTEWWTQIYADFEAAGGDGSAFWWYMDRAGGGGFDTGAGAPQLAVFRAHSAAMAAKSGGRPTTTGTPTPTTSTPSPTTSTPVPTTSGPTTSSPKPSTTKPTKKPPAKTVKKCKTGKNGKKTCRTITRKVKGAAVGLLRPEDSPGLLAARAGHGA